MLRPIVTERVEPLHEVLARVFALPIQFDPSVTRLVPRHALILGNGALQEIK